MVEQQRVLKVKGSRFKTTQAAVVTKYTKCMLVCFYIEE